MRYIMGQRSGVRKEKYGGKLSRMEREISKDEGTIESKKKTHR